MPYGPGTYGKKRGRPPVKKAGKKKAVKPKKKKGGSGNKVKASSYTRAKMALDKQKSKKKLKGMR